VSSAVHQVGVPRLEAPSREWRSHERGSEPSIRGGQVAEIRRSRELDGSPDRSPKIGGSKSRVARPRERIRVVHPRRTGGRDPEIS
jgi:hypothetical protein